MSIRVGGVRLMRFQLLRWSSRFWREAFYRTGDQIIDSFRGADIFPKNTDVPGSDPKHPCRLNDPERPTVLGPSAKLEAFRGRDVHGSVVAEAAGLDFHADSTAHVVLLVNI